MGKSVVGVTARQAVLEAFGLTGTRMRVLSALVGAVCLVAGCHAPGRGGERPEADSPEYFLLRPEVERAYGYSHAVRIGDDLIVSGAVSMDDEGNPTAVGDLQQQMENVYADLRQVLAHHGCSFDDVYVENVFTTNMARFLELAGYRESIYGEHFPTGSWLEVKGLALPEFLLEIELEARVPRKAE